MYKILLIEDDKGIEKGIIENGKIWNLEIVCVTDFRNVLKEFVDEKPHLVVVDIGLPFFNGYYWCGEIRKISKVPIIFISSAAENMNIVMAMNLGGDDFIAKPFDQEVLMAKIMAILRRTYDFGSEMMLLQHRGAILNLDNNKLIYKDIDLDLTKNEYRIMKSLMERKGKVVSREKLMEDLWKSDEYVDENTLTVNINRLRKKLNDIGLKGFITTKFGVGYIIETDE